MPFTGGDSPSPERYGGGDAGEAAPRLRRIIESIQARRGEAFTTDDDAIVAAENMMVARMIDQDVYGANERFANEMNPVHSTSSGLLPRWETVFSVPPRAGDPDGVRQARLAAADIQILGAQLPLPGLLLIEGF